MVGNEEMNITQITYTKNKYNGFGKLKKTGNFQSVNHNSNNSDVFCSCRDKSKKKSFLNGKLNFLTDIIKKVAKFFSYLIKHNKPEQADIEFEQELITPEENNSNDINVNVDIKEAKEVIADEKNTSEDFKNQINEFLENATKEERKDFFNKNLFKINILTKEKRLFILDKFEEYALGEDFFPKEKKKLPDFSNFRSSDNTKFFSQIDQWTNEEVKQRYIEVFNKYIEISPEEVTPELIDSIIFPSEEENVRKAIEKISDESLKNEMSELLSNKIYKSNSTPKGKLHNDFLKVFEKYLYPQANVTEEQKNILCKKYGEKFAENLINKTVIPLSKDEIFNLALFGTRSRRMFEFCKENADYIALLVNSGSIIQNWKITPGTFRLLVNTAKDFLNGNTSEEDIDAIIEYTNLGKYDTINGIKRILPQIDNVIENLAQNGIYQNLENEISYLEKFVSDIFNLGENFDIGKENQKLFRNKISEIKETFNNENISSETLIELLSELKSLIQSKYEGSLIEKDTNILDKITGNRISKKLNTQFVRYEGPEIFNQLQLNGEPLSKLMYDETQSENVLEFLNKEKPKLIQPSYTSTSIYPYYVKMRDNVKWLIKVDENAKGSYLTDIRNIFEYPQKVHVHRTEAEFLFAPNAIITIENAKCRDNWAYEIEASITHSPDV